MALGKNTAGKPTLLTDGKKLADLPPALLLDSVATDLDSDIDAGKVGQATVTLDKSASALVYTPDPAYLADPAVAYPVTLTAFDDDWWEPDLGNDTFVNNADYPNGYANSGLDRILVGKSDSGTVRWRGYIRFDEIPADHPLRGATVQNADLVLWNHLSSDCGQFVGSGITAYQVTARWDVSTLTWGSQPRVTTTGAETEYGGYASENCTSSMNHPWDLTHSVDDIVQAWADGEPNYGFQLTAGNESDLRNWRRYRTNEAGGCNTPPRQDCLGTLHPPILTVDFEQPDPSIFLASWTYTDEEKVDTYEEAVAAANDPARVRAFSSITTEPPLSWEEAHEQKVSSTESLNVTASELLDGPQPEEPPPSTPDPGTDTTAPEVAAVSPDLAATDVPVSTQVTATFSEAVTNAQLSLADHITGEQVAGSTAMSADSKTLTFTLSQPLTKTYYAAQVNGAKDAAGNVMEAPYIWRFSTTVEVPEPTPTPTPTPVPGLVAAYGMNEGSGVSVADSSGQNNAGTGRSTSWADGKYGKALSFNGSSSWVTVQDAASLRLTTGMTVSAWVTRPRWLTGVAWSPRNWTVEGASYSPVCGQWRRGPVRLGANRSGGILSRRGHDAVAGGHVEPPGAHL